jgi:hypothetical protein
MLGALESIQDDVISQFPLAGALLGLSGDKVIPGLCLNCMWITWHDALNIQNFTIPEILDAGCHARGGLLFLGSAALNQ